MTSLDLMTEQELIGHLRALADECERLDRQIIRAVERQRFRLDPCDVATTSRVERMLLAEMSRVMDRRRAVEGHLMRVRGQLRPLQPWDAPIST